jgi:cytoskeletal protein CcmA (bactofilin family)
MILAGIPPPMLTTPAPIYLWGGGAVDDVEGPIAALKEDFDRAMWKPRNKSEAHQQPEKPASPSTPRMISAEPSPASGNPLPETTEHATIRKSMVVKGEITGAESIYIDGRVEGSISLAGNRITVGSHGVVAADINASEIVVLGEVRGNLVASDRVDIRGTGSLFGDVVAQRISIEDGAFLKGGIDVRKSGRKTNDDAKEVPATEGKAAAGA